jgi:hypothetical protein
VEFETKLLEPLAHRIPEAPRIGFVLEVSNQIIGVAHDDHPAFGLLPSPLRSPEIEDVVQVDIGKQWGCHCALRRPRLTHAPNPFVQDARLEPLAHKTDDAFITDSVF